MKLKSLVIALALGSMATMAQANNSDIGMYLDCEGAQCEEKISEMRKFARRGSPEANYIMGVLTLFGTNVEKDEWKAKGYLMRAADGGLHEAYYLVSKIYKDGLGVDVDPAAELKFLKKAADGKSSSAEFELGIMHLKGERVEKDAQQALDYLSQAAQKRHADANFLVAKMLFEGYENIAADQDKAQDHLLAAAKRGHNGAQTWLMQLKQQNKAKPEAVAWNRPDDNTEVITVIGQPDTMSDYLEWYAEGIKSQRIYDGRSVFRTGRACTLENNCAVAEHQAIGMGMGGGNEGGGSGSN